MPRILVRMATHLLKTEPSEYAYANLVKDGTCVWSGVSNPGALIALRSMKKGDAAFIYHTGDERAIVGLAKVTRSAYADPARPGQTDSGEPKFAVVDLAPVRQARTPYTLAEIKADRRFAEFALVTRGRLSVMAVPDDLASLIREKTGLVTDSRKRPD